MKKMSLKIIASLIILLAIFNSFKTSRTIVCAAEKNEMVPGVRYVYGEKANYDFSTPEVSEVISEDTSYGSFKMTGEIASVSTKDGLNSYGVNGGNVRFSYSYDDSMLNATGEQEHLIDDKAKKINDITLSSEILKGALIVQTSRDGEIWYTVPNETETNIFANDKVRSEPFYTATDTQLMDGCYYRIIIAYETEKVIGTNKVLFVKKDDKEYHKYAEVYSFHVYDTTAEKVKVPEDDNRMNMGRLVRCTDYDSYGGEKEIDNEDPHSGWNIGSFFIGGYTDSEKDTQTGQTVFLKNNGDRISLWFNLEQDINKCRNNADITIVADTKGYDKEFDVPGGVNETMDFGKGVLMVRQKYKDNTYSKPQIYTNFLEAGASPDANTKVDLFEEGDYEVALDYAVKYNKTKLFGKAIAPQTNHYRISFAFEVRNGNTLVFLKDTKSGSDLSNGSITENGFTIDLANSQYLKVYVKREVLKDGFNGLTEDTKFNSSATNGDTFTKEGVYTITVSNQYNNASTEKRVYVGKDNLLKAYMVTGMSISEIQDQIALGATIKDDGTLIPPPELEPETEEVLEQTMSAEGKVTDDAVTSDSTSNDAKENTASALVSDEEVEETKSADNVDETKPGGVKESALPIVFISIVVVLIIFVLFKGKKLSFLINKNESGTKEENDSSIVAVSQNDKEDKE